MARGVNKVILIGHLGQDPELRYSPNGVAVCKFSLATTEGKKNAQGQWEDATEWHRVVLFNKTAEAAGEYLQKGSQVYIEGKLHYDSYTDKDGIKRYTTDVIGNRMNMLGGRGSGGGEGGGGGSTYQPPQQSAPPNQQPYNQPSNEEEDDLPF